MIRVTIELESAITGEVSTLGVLCIANDGTGSSTSGNYDAVVVRKGLDNRLRRGQMPLEYLTTRRGRVEEYPRTAYNVWRLVLRALRSAFPEEK